MNWVNQTLSTDEYLNSAYMEAGLDYNILGVDWREMEGPAKTQVSSRHCRNCHFFNKKNNKMARFTTNYTNGTSRL